MTFLARFRLYLAQRRRIRALNALLARHIARERALGR